MAGNLIIPKKASIPFDRCERRGVKIFAHQLQVTVNAYVVTFPRSSYP